MKKIVLLVLLSISIRGFAGTPDQDSAVAKVRATIVNGRTPTSAELKLGSKWKCLNLQAAKNSFVQTYTITSFGKFDGMIEVTLWAADGQSKLADSQQYMGAMTKDSKGLVGHYKSAPPWDQEVFLLRVDPGTGDLVLELSAPLSAGFGNTENYPTSAIYDPNSFAVSYVICSFDR